MFKFVGTGIFVAVAILTSSSATAQDAEIFRQKHDRTNPVPDHIAYRSFARSVYESSLEGDQGGTHYVLDSLSLPHTPDGNAFAAATAAVLLQSYVAMRTESLQANVKMLCSADGKARSNLDIYKTLDSMDDVAATVAAKHYLIAQRQFEPSALDLVLAEVASKKSTLFYAKFDHQVAYEKQGIDPQSFVVEICDNIRSELESLTN